MGTISLKRHRFALVLIALALTLPLLMPLVSRADDSDSGGANGNGDDSGIGSDFTDPNLGGGGGGQPTCNPGWTWEPTSGACVETGYCGEFNYYIWASHVCGGNCQQEMAANPYQYRTLACPSGQTGQIDQYRVGYCPNPPSSPPAYGAWITTSNTCVALPTVTITAPGGTPGPTANVIVGQTATITWSCPSPNTSSSGVNFSTGGAASGSTGVVVTADKTYTVVCDQTSAQASVTVTAVNANMSLVASPSRVRSGATTVLTWSASGVTSCSLSGPGTSDSATAVSGSIASRNKTTAAITGQSTYTLTCQTTATPIRTSVNVLLIPNSIEI